ncbi:hypothetical protein [Erythrobacter sp. R86502]
MSPQLTLSSLFCVLALAGLCVVTSAQDFLADHHSGYEQQAERTPGLQHG